MKKIIMCIIVILAMVIEILIVIPYFRTLNLDTWILNILFIMSFALSFGIALVISLPLLIIIKFFVSRISYKREENKMKFGIEKIEYFRNILENSNPAILSYILNGKTKYEKDLAATLFALTMHNHIELKENDIVLLNENQDFLSHEKLLLGWFKFGVISKDFERSWSKQIIADCINLGFLKERKENNKDFIYMIGVATVIVIPLMIVAIIFDILLVPFLLILLIASLILIFKGTLILIDKILYKKSRYIKTEKGFELYYNLKGLQNFLFDFSKLNERTKEEFVLWKDYIIYAVIFDMNELLTNELKDNYKQIELFEKNRLAKFKS